MAGIPPSQERTALVSLAYNSKVDPVTGIPTTLGSKLKAAVQNNDRAEAWYEIRYDTNKNALSASPPRDASGLAKRRYFEADTFGLYGNGVTPATLTDADAKGVFRTYTRHKDQINAYEALYANKVSAANTTTVSPSSTPRTATSPGPKAI